MSRSGTRRSGSPAPGEGSLTLSQSGGSLGSTRERTGSCDTPAGALDHSGTFELAEGFLTATRVEFEWHGAHFCAYVGELVGVPVASVSGTLSCVRNFNGTPIPLRGGWEMSR